MVNTIFKCNTINNGVSEFYTISEINDSSKTSDNKQPFIRRKDFKGKLHCSYK